MNDQTDSQLLRAYAEQRSEAAFAELVRRRVCPRCSNRPALGTAITASAATSIPAVAKTSTLIKGLIIMASTKSKLVTVSATALLLIAGGTTALLVSRSSSANREVTSTASEGVVSVPGERETAAAVC